METNLLNPYIQFCINSFDKKERYAEELASGTFNKKFRLFLSQIIERDSIVVSQDLILKFKSRLMDDIPSFTSDVKEAILILKEFEAYIQKYTVQQKESKVNYLIQQLPQLCWAIGASGEGLYFNSNWNSYTGFNSESYGEWKEAIHENDITDFDLLWQQKSVSNEVFSFEYRLRDYNAQFRWFSLKCIPLINEIGELYWLGINTDINELVEASEKIESINYDLDNFIYIASHDLKAPISNLEGLLHIIEDLLGKKLQEDEILRSVLQMISESIVKLQATIKDLANVSKIQRNLSEDIEEVVFSEIIGDVTTEIQAEIDDSNAIIHTMLESAPVVRFSKQDMKSVLSNLISNAIKYKSPERQPEVIISSEKKDGQVILMVKDNGLGIPSDKKEYIFNMFKRLHDHVDGSGIGLYIVKRIIDNNQGMIEVESEIGQGSMFKVYFPEE